MNGSLPLLKRLVGAFEALALEEQTLLHHRQYTEMAALQERELPIAARIAELITEPGMGKRMDSELRDRIRRIIASLQSKAQVLDQAMHEARVALAELDHAAVRARTVRPAYGRLSTRSSVGAFSAEG